MRTPDIIRPGSHTACRASRTCLPRNARANASSSRYDKDLGVAVEGNFLGGIGVTSAVPAADRNRPIGARWRDGASPPAG
jgi:hypothetical protein